MRVQRETEWTKLKVNLLLFQVKCDVTSKCASTFKLKMARVCNACGHLYSPHYSRDNKKVPLSFRTLSPPLLLLLVSSCSFSSNSAMCQASTVKSCNAIQSASITRSLFLYLLLTRDLSSALRLMHLIWFNCLFLFLPSARVSFFLSLSFGPSSRLLFYSWPNCLTLRSQCFFLSLPLSPASCLLIIVHCLLGHPSIHFNSIHVYICNDHCFRCHGKHSLSQKVNFNLLPSFLLLLLVLFFSFVIFSPLSLSSSLLCCFAQQRCSLNLQSIDYSCATWVTRR